MTPTGARHVLRLIAHPERLAICRLAPETSLPAWATAGRLWSATRTHDELSVVCAAAAVPEGTLVESPFRALQIVGPLDFALVGVLAGLATTLAAAGISLFAISTYDTDYLLVRERDLDAARRALQRAGHTVDLL